MRSAFPREDYQLDLPNGQSGMSLREYYASKCDVSLYKPLETIKATGIENPTIGELAEYIATIRFIEADAMIMESTR
jgi:hypothetical protein